MFFRTSASSSVWLVVAALLGAAAVAILGGCSQNTSSTQASVYQDPPEMTATYDSLESLAANTGKTLGFEDYESVYKHFMSQYPNSTPLHRDWQSTLDAFNRSDEKVEMYKKLHEDNPESAMYAYLYGRVLPDGQDREMFKQAIELDPDYFWGNFGYAIVSLRSNPVDTAEGIKYLEKALEADMTYPSVYTQLININEERGNLDAALEYAKGYARTSPESYRPIEAQVDLLNRLNRADEAEKLLLDFANAHEDNGGVRTRLVEYYKSKDNLAEALKWQYQVVKISRDPDAALVDVAKLHLAMNQADSALWYLNEAAGRGYADFRRVANNPELAAVKEVEGFDKLMTTLKTNAEAARDQRLAGFLENAAANRTEAIDGKLNEVAPTFAFKNLEGKTVALEDLRGSVVVIDFWATWCGPCRMTMPVLQEFVDRAPANVEFLSLNVWEDDQSKVQPFIQDFGYSFNVLYGDNQVASDYGVTGIPTMVVIDPQGKLQYRHVGYDPHLDQILLWQTEHLLKQSGGTQAKL